MTNLNGRLKKIESAMPDDEPSENELPPGSLAIILGALEPFPEARWAVGAALYNWAQSKIKNHERGDTEA